MWSLFLYFKALFIVNCCVLVKLSADNQPFFYEDRRNMCGYKQFCGELWSHQTCVFEPFDVCLCGSKYESLLVEFYQYTTVSFSVQPIDCFRMGVCFVHGYFFGKINCTTIIGRKEMYSTFFFFFFLQYFMILLHGGGVFTFIAIS